MTTGLQLNNKNSKKSHREERSTDAAKSQNGFLRRVPKVLLSIVTPIGQTMSHGTITCLDTRSVQNETCWKRDFQKRNVEGINQCSNNKMKRSAKIMRIPQSFQKISLRAKSYIEEVVFLWERGTGRGEGTTSIHIQTVYSITPE